MVSQVRPETGKVLHQGRADAAYLLGLSDARSHEEARRLDGPRAHDDLAAAHGAAFAVGLDLDAGGPPPVEDDPACQRVRPDRQVGAFTAEVQIADRRADPEAVGAVDRPGADAPRVGQVHVGVVGEAGVAAGLVEGARDGTPRLLLGVPYQDWAVLPVIRAAEVQVRFEFLEIGQQLVVRPRVVPCGGPLVVVLRRAPVEVGRVHRAAPAGDLARHDDDGLAPVGVAARGVRPEVGPVVHRHHHVVPVADVFGKLIDPWVVGARLEQQH